MPCRNGSITVAAVAVAAMGAERDTARAMSEQAIEVVMQAFDALSRGTPDDAPSCFTDDVEWHNTTTFPGPRKLVGWEALIRFRAEMSEPWSVGGERIEEIRTGGDRVVVAVHSWGEGRGSGIPIDEHWAMSFTLRAGKVARVDVRGSFAKALEAAGLAE
jgi:ketosteroid isomerase-like protein